jgi:hypothetical protein
MHSFRMTRVRVRKHVAPAGGSDSFEKNSDGDENDDDEERRVDQHDEIMQLNGADEDEDLEESRVVTKKRKRGGNESTSSSGRRSWTAEEDARIIQLKEIEKKSWPDIANCFTGRTQAACKGEATADDDD